MDPAKPPLLTTLAIAAKVQDIDNPNLTVNLYKTIDLVADMMGGKRER